MNPGWPHALVVSLAFFVLAPSLADAAGVQARFDLDDRRGGPFPSDRFTVADASQNTGRRVSLPKPDCTARPTDCADLDVINTLDGFNVQPRLSIPFDGPLEVTSVTSRTVFLVRLGSTRPGHHHGRDGHRHGPHITGINQVVWDVATTTLHAESDEILDQHTRYALIVTRGVRDTRGVRSRWRKPSGDSGMIRALGGPVTIPSSRRIGRSCSTHSRRHAPREWPRRTS